jgi:hypothetical protein
MAGGSNPVQTQSIPRRSGWLAFSGAAFGATSPAIRHDLDFSRSGRPRYSFARPCLKNAPWSVPTAFEWKSSSLPDRFAARPADGSPSIQNPAVDPRLGRAFSEGMAGQKNTSANQPDNTRFPGLFPSQSLDAFGHVATDPFSPVVGPFQPVNGYWEPCVRNRDSRSGPPNGHGRMDWKQLAF